RFEAKFRIPSVLNAFSLTAADYDNDSDLDLFVCRYFAKKEDGAQLATPVPYFDANNGGGNYLIRNDGRSKQQGDWISFSDATVESGLDGQNNRRFSFASVWEDLDNDGDQDLFVANDFGLKNLYVNEGGTFRDLAPGAGVDDGGFGMSASAGDFDRDGIPDLYAGNMFSAAGNRITSQPGFRPEADDATRARFRRMARGNSLFRGLGGSRNGGPGFADVSEPTGVTVGRWSWGSIFADLDQDGWEDLVVANGFVTGRVPDDL
ncbi:MAG: VCBS repeat-containing protein, partial [Verrucomicrobiota bacterium]